MATKKVNRHGKHVLLLQGFPLNALEEQGGRYILASREASHGRLPDFALYLRCHEGIARERFLARYEDTGVEDFHRAWDEFDHSMEPVIQRYIARGILQTVRRTLNTREMIETANKVCVRDVG